MAANVGGAVGAMPVSASTSGKAGGENITPHGLHHGDRRNIRALLGGQHGDLRQRAGAAGQKAEVWSSRKRCR